MDESKIGLSVIVLTKNEQSNIATCLRSLEQFAEVFVVDSSSSDGTKESATQLGAKVVLFEWNGKYPKKKQWALDHLPFSYDWVLYVDADEQVPLSLSNEILSRLGENASHAGYVVGYDYVFMGRTLTHGAQAEKLVLVNRHKARFSEVDDLDAQNMWEVEGHYQPQINGTVGRLHNRMIHNDHESLFHYFDRHNRYTDWEAVVRSSDESLRQSESHDPGRSRLKYLFARLPGKPVVSFLYSYIFKAGFLDGRPGFDFALSRAFYYWQTDLKKRELAARAKSSKK